MEHFVSREADLGLVIAFDFERKTAKALYDLPKIDSDDGVIQVAREVRLSDAQIFALRSVWGVIGKSLAP